jgi:hypothetical protein
MKGGNKMIRQPVQSSNINSVGFDSDDNTLQIKFNSGGIYNYYNVPKRVYTTMLAAPSKGKYFHKNIKGKYKFTEII